MEPAPRRLSLQYFDGRSARACAAEIWLARDELHIATEGQVLRHPRRAVRWPERQRHGQRLAQLPDGGVLSALDARDWDEWARASGLHESLAVRWAQSWRHVLAAVVLLGLLLVGLWRVGVPWATEAVLALLPAEAEQQIGSSALAGLDERWLRPSALPAARRAAIERDFAALLSAADPQRRLPAYRLEFRAADSELGPNALALPGGTIVLTDALADLLADAPDALAGVLAHELGHLEQRHGLRLVVQAGLASSVAGLVLGDFSAVLAGVPALLSQLAYSRDFEREADASARRLLLAGGRSPRAMLLFFERIEQYQRERPQTALPIALSSHPADEERRRFFAR